MSGDCRKGYDSRRQDTLNVRGNDYIRDNDWMCSLRSGDEERAALLMQVCFAKPSSRLVFAWRMKDEMGEIFGFFRGGREHIKLRL